MFALLSSHLGLGPGSRLIVLDSSSIEGANVVSEFLTREEAMRDLLRRMRRDAAAEAFQVAVTGKFKAGFPITVD